MTSEQHDQAGEEANSPPLATVSVGSPEWKAFIEKLRANYDPEAAEEKYLLEMEEAFYRGEHWRWVRENESEEDRVAQRLRDEEREGQS